MFLLFYGSEFSVPFYEFFINFPFVIASEESILLSHMGPPKSAIISLILVLEQFYIEDFFILFQF